MWVLNDLLLKNKSLKKKLEKKQNKKKRFFIKSETRDLRHTSSYGFARVGLKRGVNVYPTVAWWGRGGHEVRLGKWISETAGASLREN